MLVGFFDKLNDDLSWINNSHPKSNLETENEINIRLEAAKFRITGRLAVAGAAALTFVALPLISCGVGIIFLAGAVLLYIAGHDLFKMGDNLENHLSAYTSIGTLGKAIYSGLFYGEEAAQESIAWDFTNHTILRSLWMELFKNHRKNLRTTLS